MDGLLRQIGGYCERTDPGYWSEPVNAITNAAFLIAALLTWRRLGRARLPLARCLCVLLGAIGVGSFLFHTHGQVWAAIADVVPIALFSLTYIFAANRDFWGWPLWAAALGALAYLPYTALLAPVFGALPFFEVSAVYWPLPVLILAYAAGLRNRAPQTARGLALGAVLLCISLSLRSLDERLCSVVPLGTHFVWHILNGILLGWMI